MATYPLSNYSSDLVTAATQGIQSPDALTLTHSLNMGVGGDHHGSVLLACQGKANLLKSSQASQYIYLGIQVYRML